MKITLSMLAAGLLALGVPQQSWAQKTQGELVTDGNFGPRIKSAAVTETLIKTLDGETLGRVQNLVLDLSNSRIVAVLAVSDQTLRLGGKTIALPPLALHGAGNNTLLLNMSKEAFKAAPAFDMAKDKWEDSTQPARLAAAYRYFGQEPYFTFPGEGGKSAVPGSEYVHLGYIASMETIVNMPVTNLKGEKLGTLQTLVLNVQNGTILKVYINAGTVGTMLKFSTIIQPSALTFNAKHDGLLLDDTKVEYADEPRVIFDTGSAGENTTRREQPSADEQAKVGLVQGTSSRDINTTAQIYKSIQDGKFDAKEQVEVATLNGRVTLRGGVDNQAAKDGIAAIAVAAVKSGNVNNQIKVTALSQASL